MRSRVPGATVAAVAIVVMIVGARGGIAQQGQGPSAPPRNPTPAHLGLAMLHDMFLRFPLPPGQEAYANIDGKRLHQYVVEQANISRRYRDAGHPKFWGRITGTAADAEDAEWMIVRFKAAGLIDVRRQPYDLVPQWFPQAWDVTVTANGKTIIDEVNRLPLSTLQRPEEPTRTSASGGR